jgi:hypothetical protein
MRRIPLHEVRRRTCKPLDSWWTVLLVDPYATRLVRLVAPWHRVTPDRLTALAAVFGAGAAACFVAGHPHGGDSQPRDSLRTRPAQHPHRCFSGPAINWH